MRFFFIFLAILNGGYMLIDGIHVLLKGKYIGPPEPGPWASLFNRLHVDVLKLGPLFILFGVLWLAWACFLWTGQSKIYVFGLILSVATLWYLPFGTLIAAATLILIIMARGKMGL